MERIIDADQEMLLISLQREMTEMKRRTEEAIQKNEQKMQDLRRENDEMKKKLMEGGPSTEPTNVVDRSFASPSRPRPVEETKDKILTHEMRENPFWTGRPRRPSPRTRPADTRSPTLSLKSHYHTSERVSTEIDMTGLPTRTSILMHIPPI